jgi:hypothetical protein
VPRCAGRCRRYDLPIPPRGPSALRLTLRTVGDEVALAGALGLEAIRLMRPDLFAALVSCADELGYSSLPRPHDGALRSVRHRIPPIRQPSVRAGNEGCH